MTTDPVGDTLTVVSEEKTQTVWDLQTSKGLSGPQKTRYGRGRMTNFPLAIRTNLLLPALNVGVEVPVGRHSSLEADCYYPWGQPDPTNKYCFQVLLLNAGYRYWFSSTESQGRRCKTNLTGHSLGLNAIWSMYDLQWAGDGSQGDIHGGGADYTYACCIARGRLRLEFSAGVGVVWLTDRPYKVYSDGGALLRESNLPVRRGTFFLPTKCCVSLVVPLGRDGKKIPKEVGND